MTRYDFGLFVLDRYRSSGLVVTVYLDGCNSGCEPHADDEFHGARLGLSAARHRLHHEITHHVVGRAFYGGCGSPIVDRDAHGIAQPASAAREEEWMVTAMQYYSRDRNFDEAALVKLARSGAKLGRMKRLILWLLDAPNNVTVDVCHAFSADS